MRDFKISSTGLFRYHSSNSLEKMEKLVVSYIDMVEVENTINENNPFGALNPLSSSQNIPTLGVQVFTKKVDPTTIKTIKIDELNKLYEDILNFYVDNQLIFDKDLSINYNDDDKKIFNRITLSSNVIAQLSRVGPGNIAIMSQKIYDKLKKHMVNLLYDFSFHINPTDIHNDKIIILRLKQQMSDIGVSIITDASLDNSRYLKLKKIASKLDLKVPNMEINYTILPIGNKYQNTICVINLIDYEG